MEKFSPAINYTLSVLLEDNEFHRYIYYTDEELTGDTPCVQIIPSRFFTDDLYGSSESLPGLPLKEIEGIPLLFGEPKIERQGSRIIIYADVIASAYFLLTRYEEFVRKEDRDQYGRFPFKESLAYRAGFAEIPVVEEYSTLLISLLQKINISIPASKRNFSVLLTHDIDDIRKYKSRFHFIRTFFSVLKGRQPPMNFLKAMQVCLGWRKDPYDTFDEMIEIDSRLYNDTAAPAASPIFFFISGGKGEIDKRYDIRSRAVSEAIGKIKQAGFQIGLHASHEAGRHPELVAAEKAKLESVSGQPVVFNRYHYLSWLEIEDGEHLQSAGMEEDFTMGFPEICGFRLGVCHPVELFDPIKIRPMGMIEHPMIIMEAALKSEEYCFKDISERFEFCVKLMDETKKHQGELVINWHNNSFADESKNIYLHLYKKIIDYLSQN